MGNLVVEAGCVVLEGGGTLTSTTKTGVPIFCVGVVEAGEEHISSGKGSIIPYGSGRVYAVVTSCIEVILNINFKWLLHAVVTSSGNINFTVHYSCKDRVTTGET